MLFFGQAAFEDAVLYALAVVFELFADVAADFVVADVVGDHPELCHGVPLVVC